MVKNKKEITIPENYRYAGKRLEEIISQREIDHRIKEIAGEISTRYDGNIPIIIGVLNGSFLFLADLVRHLTIDFEIDFLKIASYGNSTKSSGTVRLLKHISSDISGRDVIVVEDIVDTGLSLTFLKHRLEEAGPSSVSFATCLYKPEIARHDFDIDYIGFNIENQFVVGYGLDIDQKFRGLSSIYAFKKGEIEDV